MCQPCIRCRPGFPGVRVIWSVWWAVEKVHWQLHGNLTRYVCPRDASFYKKSRKFFYYLLCRAHSIFINLISYILHFIFCYLLIALCSFFSRVYVRKSVIFYSDTAATHRYEVWCRRIWQRFTEAKLMRTDEVHGGIWSFIKYEFVKW